MMMMLLLLLLLLCSQFGESYFQQENGVKDYDVRVNNKYLSPLNNSKRSAWPSG